MADDTMTVPRAWLIKCFDTLTTLQALLEGEKPSNAEMLASDVDWLTTAANVMLLESE